MVFEKFFKILEGDKSPDIEATLAEVPPAPKLPTVYEAAIEMLAGALTIYTFADIRAMARSGELPTALSDLDTPMTTDKMVDIIKENKEVLMAKAIVDHEDLEKRLISLKALSENESKIIDAGFGQERADAILTHFVDDKADEEMVHGIVVNHIRKRVTVLFRGSVTQKDFLTDAKIQQKKIPNPVFHIENAETTDTISVHTGFYEYLFKIDAETGKGRLELILDDVKQLLRENPGYRLYCTGHSLGGALSTLFGFYAAADDEITQSGGPPVMVVSIASPLVGNMKFRVAFQALERMKRLRHLRIANKDDMVTVMPFAAPKLTVFSPILAAAMGAGNLYKHCGMRLLLVPPAENDDSPPYDISYAKDHSDDEAYEDEVKRAKEAGKSLLDSLAHVMKRDTDKIRKFHGCDTYEARLELCKDDLMKVTIEDLYQNKEIVGKVLDEDHKPEMMLTVSARASRLMKKKDKPKKEEKVENAS